MRNFEVLFGLKSRKAMRKEEIFGLKLRKHIYNMSNISWGGLMLIMMLALVHEIKFFSFIYHTSFLKHMLFSLEAPYGVHARMPIKILYWVTLFFTTSGSREGRSQGWCLSFFMYSSCFIILSRYWDDHPVWSSPLFTSIS